MADRESRPLIAKVWARNFRSIEFAELELEPLTVLVGPNASGKSNLLATLGFFGDMARLGLEPAITRRGGIDSIGRRSPNGKVSNPEVGFEYESPEGRQRYSFTLMRRSKAEYKVKRESARLEPAHAAPMEIELVDGRLTKLSLYGVARPPGFALRGTAKALLKEIGDQDLQLIPTGSRRMSTLWSLLLTPQKRGEDNPYVPFRRLLRSLQNASLALSRIHMYHIFPDVLREPQKMADSHPLAVGGGNLASTLRDMIQKKSDFLPDLREALNYAVPGVRDIRVIRAGSYYVIELNHDRGGGIEKGSWFDLSYESDGTIRLLGMLVALFQEPSPSLIGIEEPELAIHPGAMAVLAENIGEASLRGQVLVATHSPDLINLLPMETIRAVTAEDGSTRVGRVAESQLESVKQNLFSAGELHSIEGLHTTAARE